MNPEFKNEPRHLAGAVCAYAPVSPRDLCRTLASQQIWVPRRVFGAEIDRTTPYLFAGILPFPGHAIRQLQFGLRFTARVNAMGDTNVQAGKTRVFRSGELSSQAPRMIGLGEFADLLSRNQDPIGDSPR